MVVVVEALDLVWRPILVQEASILSKASVYLSI